MFPNRKGSPYRIFGDSLEDTDPGEGADGSLWEPGWMWPVPGPPGQPGEEVHTEHLPPKARVWWFTLLFLSLHSGTPWWDAGGSAGLQPIPSPNPTQSHLFVGNHDGPIPDQIKFSCGLLHLVSVQSISCIAGALVWVWWENLPTFPQLAC